MDYNNYLKLDVDVTDVFRMTSTGQLTTLKTGKPVSMRELLSGLDRAYLEKEKIEKAIFEMEQCRLGVDVSNLTEVA